MKFIINKKEKNKIPSTKLYDLGTADLGIDNLLDLSIINIDQNTIPILKINDSHFLINNFNPNNYKEDFEIILTENDLISFSGGGSGIESITGDLVDNTDPLNPIINAATNTATVTVELVNSLSTDFYAPDDLRINTTDTIFGVGTITLKVNDVAYTLTDLIIKGEKITVETNSESVFNLNIIYE